MSVRPPDGQSNGSQGGGKSIGDKKKQVMTWFGKLNTIVEYDPDKCCRSDGDPCVKKETKFCTNSTDNCWLYGWDVAKGHTSKTCWTRAKGHKEEATPYNLMGGNMKDFQFSSYAWRHGERQEFSLHNKKRKELSSVLKGSSNFNFNIEILASPSSSVKFCETIAVATIINSSHCIAPHNTEKNTK